MPITSEMMMMVSWIVMHLITRVLIHSDTVIVGTFMVRVRVRVGVRVRVKIPSE